MVSMINKVQQRDLIGSLFYFGILQFVLAVLIGEGTAINYNSAIHYMSTLGTGSTAFLFSASVALLGLCMVFCSYFLQREYGKFVPTSLLLLTGICAIGVGVFPESVRPLHGIFTGFVFLFAALFLLSSFKLDQSPLFYLLSVLGGVLLFLLFLLFPYLGLEVESSVQFLGFFKGTLERFIIYLTLLSYLLLGGLLSR
jgi:hypothetical membrane protein